MLGTWVHLWYLDTYAVGGTPQPGQLGVHNGKENVAPKGYLHGKQEPGCWARLDAEQDDSGVSAGPRRQVSNPQPPA